MEGRADEWMDPNHVMVVLTEQERHHALVRLAEKDCPICAAVVEKLRRVATETKGSSDG